MNEIRFLPCQLVNNVPIPIRWWGEGITKEEFEADENEGLLHPQSRVETKLSLLYREEDKVLQWKEVGWSAEVQPCDDPNCDCREVIEELERNRATAQPHDDPHYTNERLER
jgi:hypothetical protein